MDPVYSDVPGDCYPAAIIPGNPGGESRPACFAATRNNPFPDSRPGFVVWALSTEHVQKALKFAVKHNLCVAVAGTGHDFMGRHSCKNGIFIRTTMLKGMDFD